MLKSPLLVIADLLHHSLWRMSLLGPIEVNYPADGAQKPCSREIVSGLLPGKVTRPVIHQTHRADLAGQLVQLPSLTISLLIRHRVRKSAQTLPHLIFCHFGETLVGVDAGGVV